MSNILKGLNEGRNYGRDSWDSNMPGYQGDYGGAENFGRRNREDDEHHDIDRQREQQLQQYNQYGKFWLKLKDSQRHLPAGPFTGKQAANSAALDLLKQQPELKGNLLITSYGPDEQLDELSPQTLASYKKKAGADASASDKRGDYKRGDKRMSGIIKATKKEFDNDSKGVAEGSEERWTVTVGSRTGGTSHTMTFNGTKEQAIKKAIARFSTSKNPVVKAVPAKQGVAEGQLDEISAKLAQTVADKRSDKVANYRAGLAATGVSQDSITAYPPFRKMSDKARNSQMAAKRRADKEQGVAEAKRKPVGPTFTKFDNYDQWSNEMYSRGAEYDETEVDGYLVGVAVIGRTYSDMGYLRSPGKVVGFWYNRAKYGSFVQDGVAFDDVIDYAEKDTQWPYMGESAIMKGLVDENLGTPYPGTYEQETNSIKHKSQQQRVQKIAFEGKK